MSEVTWDMSEVTWDMSEVTILSEVRDFGQNCDFGHVPGHFGHVPGHFGHVPGHLGRVPSHLGRVQSPEVVLELQRSCSYTPWLACSARCRVRRGVAEVAGGVWACQPRRRSSYRGSIAALQSSLLLFAVWSAYMCIGTDVWAPARSHRARIV